MRIVDLLEVVEIDQQHAERLPGFVRLAQQLVENIVEVAAVEHAGERVAPVRFAQARVGFRQLFQRRAEFAGAARDVALELLVRFAHDALVLAAQVGVAEGEGEGEQDHFGRRADLDAVFGDEGLGQQADRDRSVHGRAEQQHRPGGEEELGRAVATADRVHGLVDDGHHAGEDAVGAEFHRQAVIDEERGDADQGEEGDQSARDQVAQRPALLQFEELAGELVHRDLRYRHRQRNGVVGQPGRTRPQVFEGQAVEAEHHQAEAGDMAHVPEVAAVAQRQPQNQVIEEQREQDAVVDADADLRVALHLGEGAEGVQRQRRLHRALALRAHQQFDFGALRQIHPEIRVTVADGAGGEGQHVAGGEMVHAAVGIAQIDIDVVEQRVFQHQQPALFGIARVEQPRMEPVGPIDETEGRVAMGQGFETVRFRRLEHRARIDATAGIHAIGDMRGQFEAGQARAQFGARLRRAGRGTQREEKKQQREQPDCPSDHATPPCVHINRPSGTTPS